MVKPETWLLHDERITQRSNKVASKFGFDPPYQKRPEVGLDKIYRVRYVTASIIISCTQGLLQWLLSGRDSDMVLSTGYTDALLL